MKEKNIFKLFKVLAATIIVFYVSYCSVDKVIAKLEDIFSIDIYVPSIICSIFIFALLLSLSLYIINALQIRSDNEKEILELKEKIKKLEMSKQKRRAYEFEENHRQNVILYRQNAAFGKFPYNNTVEEDEEETN